MSANTSAEALSASTASFVTSLVVNTAVAGGEFVAFVLLRGWIKAIYEPRTYIPPKKDQAGVLGRNPYMALWKIVVASPEEVLHKNGVDPYVFIRFLHMMAYAMIPIWLISWVILLPVDSVNSTVAGKEGLDMFTFGNVAKDKQSRYWAHLILDYVFIAWFLFLICREMQNWLLIRQKHLINPAHSKLAQANTVLITGIPKEYLDEGKLEELFSYLPGGVKRIWLNRNLKEMPDLWSRRLKAAAKLESAQVEIIKLARKTRLAREKKIADLTAKKKKIPESLAGPVNPDLVKAKTKGASRSAVNLHSETSNDTEQATSKELSLADQLVPRNKRPMIRLKPSWAPFGLGFLGIGQKIDAIEWARKEIAECSQGLEKSRQQLTDDINSPGVAEDYYPPLNSAFIHFNQQIAAHMAVQVLTSHQPYKMNNRYIEQAPGNVIWRNLSMTAYERNVREVISWALTVGLIIVWAFPSAFVGALSNISTLTATYSWLRWIEGDSTGKKILQGVISGVLPPVLLALLNLILPIILRQLAAFEGIPSRTGVELNLMTKFFIHQVINTFLIVTLSSGLISSIGPIAQNPASIATILASQLPTASTFFITLVLTQFTGTVGNLLQPISLLFYYIRLILLGGSPRSQYTSKYSLQTPTWGTQWPSITVYSVIMVSYCVISPIINGFGACFFLLSAVVFKYLFIWVYDQPPESDTGGVFFPKAITHVFVGIYIQEVCLCTLFFLARNDNLEVSALPQAILMIILIVLTAAFQYVLNMSYGPLVDSLPLSLAHLSYGMDKVLKQRASESDETSVTPPANSSQERLTSEKNPQQKEQNFIFSAGRKVFDNRVVNDIRDNKVVKDIRDTRMIKDISRRDKVMEELELAHMQPEEEVSPATATAPGPPAGPTTSDPSGNPDHPRDAEGQDDEEEEVFFAVPGGPGLAKGLRDDGNDPKAFFHPATKDPQRIIWLPRDELGLCKAEIEANIRLGVLSSDRFAILNHKGQSQIFGPPPDEL